MNLIKQKLKELGKSQAWLAREAGVSESTVSKAANGSSGLRIDSLVFIAKALNLPVESLAKDLSML